MVDLSALKKILYGILDVLSDLNGGHDSGTSNEINRLYDDVSNLTEELEEEEE